MVLETIAAVGLASSIVQFVAFIFETLSKSREVCVSVSGITAEYTDLRTIAQDLVSLRDQLGAHENAIPNLSPISVQCVSIAQEILAAIVKIQQKFMPHYQNPTAAVTTRSSTNLIPPSNCKKWKSFRAALKCVWKKPKLTELQLRLERLRDELIFNLILDQQ